jgi:hypothetical protein
LASCAGSIAAPVVTDLRAAVDYRAEWVRDSGATHYDAAGAATVIPPPRWPADPQATGIPWSALGKDGTLNNNEGARMYSRVCWLFAPQYGVDLTPPKPKRKRGAR